MADTLAILSAYADARWRLRFSDRAALEAHQRRRFGHFSRTVLARSPHYRRWAGQPLEALPTIDKPGMEAHFGAINLAGIGFAEAMDVALEAEETRDFSPTIRHPTLGEISVGLSTGTSGRRGLFLVGPGERARWAGTMLAKMLPRSVLARHRIAFFLRANNRLYETVSGRGRIAFRFFDLQEPLERHLPALAAFAPTTLIAPAQILRLLAGARPSIRPDRVISVAEVLEPDDRPVIEGAFGPVLHEVYQATEGFLGATCRLGTLHLNESFVHVERAWLDDTRRRFVPIVTDLYRSTQPIVRYRLDDVLEPREAACPCGNPELALARIQGRRDDLLGLPGRAGGRVLVMPDFVGRAVLGASARIRDFRVEQAASGDLTVSLLCDDLAACAEPVRQALAALAARHGALPPAVTVAPLGASDPLAKRRRVVRVVA